jgi:hypothetical protein
MKNYNITNLEFPGEKESDFVISNIKKANGRKNNSLNSTNQRDEKNGRYANLLVTYMSYVLEMKRLVSLIGTALTDEKELEKFNRNIASQYIDFMKDFFPFYCRQKVIIGHQVGEDGVWEFKKISSSLFRSLQSSYNVLLNDDEIQILFTCMHTVSLLSIGEPLKGIKEKYERNIIFT